MELIGRAFYSFVVNLFFFTSLFGQLNSPNHHEEPTKLTFYYTNSWELTTPEKHSFRREAYFDLQEMVFDGVYQDYNKDNKLVAEGFYAHGVKSGIQTEHFDDQTIKSTIEFSADDFILWQLVDNNKQHEVANGTGKFSMPFYYFFDYYLKQGTMTGEFINGKKSGNWVYLDQGRIKTDVEHYRNGKLLDRIYFTKGDSAVDHQKKEIILSINAILTEAMAWDKNTYSSVNQFFWQQITYPVSFQRNVSYPGGLKKLLRLLFQEAQVPEKNLVLVKIKIDELGQISKSNIVRSVNTLTDIRVLSAIENHKRRILPAIKNGKPYATTIYLPVAGGEEWLKQLQTMPTEWFLDVNNFIN